MYRLLERLDAAASTIVPLLYLGGLTIGTLSYFTGITADLGIAVGVGLAIAAETHAFLQQRRLRVAWGVLSRTPRDDPRRPMLAAQLRVSAAILAALVAFTTYNAMAFAAATWHPSPGFLPVWAQIAVRGLVVPVFFLLSGFLAPLQADAGGLLAAASHDMLHKTISATTRQWRRRVERAKRGGVDLAPVAVALMLDAGDEDGARRVRLIAEGLSAAERGDPPPTPGGGLPLPAPGEARALELASGGVPGPILRLPRPTRRRGATSATMTDEERRVRAALTAAPGLSKRQLAAAAHVSASTASKYLALVRAEQERARKAG